MHTIQKHQALARMPPAALRSDQGRRNQALLGPLLALLLAPSALASIVRGSPPRAAYVRGLSMSAAPTNPSRLRLVANKRCPFVQKAWIALEEYHGGKANAYELLEVGLYGANGKPGWFLDLNSKGQVPVLWLPSGRVITESDAILDHLASLDGRKAGQPNPLTPPQDAPFKKWRSLLPPFLKGARTAVERGDSPGLSSLLFKLNKDMPTPGPYLAGDSFSIADASVLPFVQRLVEEHGDVVRETAPKLYEWFQLCTERQSFRVTRVPGWWWWW